MVYFLSQDIDLPTHFFFSLTFIFSKTPCLLCWFFPEDTSVLIGNMNSKNEIGRLTVLHNEFHSHKVCSWCGLLSEEAGLSPLLPPHSVRLE